jgi:hypothetical protein
LAHESDWWGGLRNGSERWVYFAGAPWGLPPRAPEIRPCPIMTSGPSDHAAPLLDQDVVAEAAIEYVEARPPDQDIVAGTTKRGPAGASSTRYTMTSNVSGALATPSSSRAITTMVSW